MNRSCLHIHHPQPYQVIYAAPFVKDGKTYFALAVNGRSHGCKNLVTCLIDHEDPFEVHHGKVLPRNRDPQRPINLHWTCVFDTLKELPDGGRLYHLFVAEVGGLKPIQEERLQTGNRVVSVELLVRAGGKLRANSGKKRQYDYATVQIMFPGANAVLSPSFTAFGINSTNGPPLTCTMTLEGQSTPTSSAAIQDMQNGTWVAQFTNVPENSGYILYAGRDAEDKDEKSNLTVNGMAVPPIVAPPPPPPVPPIFP